MPRSTKANLLWVNDVGTKVASELSALYARPMIYRQAGPYNQTKTPHVSIYFNDPILHHVVPIRPGHKVDFRFGFVLERSFSPVINNYAMFAGFEIYNPTLSTRFLMPNILSNCGTVSTELMAWLRQHQYNSGFVNMGAGGGGNCLISADDEPEALYESLKSYATPERGVESKKWKRYCFSALNSLTKFKRWEESTLINSSSEFANSALSTFKELDFLYSLLFPRDLGPSRMNSGQNRALMTKQPDRRCSWISVEHCGGDIQAAHIKPDRMGGHAVPGNLFWLCQFHHKLLDAHFKAELSIDRLSSGVVARVRTTSPALSKGGGIPMSIWESIENKADWKLPLRTESICPLFDG